jgi:hypothetical protein
MFDAYLLKARLDRILRAKPHHENRRIEGLTDPIEGPKYSCQRQSATVASMRVNGRSWPCHDLINEPLPYARAAAPKRSADDDA